MFTQLCKMMLLATFFPESAVAAGGLDVTGVRQRCNSLTVTVTVNKSKTKTNVSVTNDVKFLNLIINTLTSFKSSFKSNLFKLF